jgi:hypothetical protein
VVSGDDEICRSLQFKISGKKNLLDGAPMFQIFRNGKSFQRKIPVAMNLVRNISKALAAPGISPTSLGFNP